MTSRYRIAGLLALVTSIAVLCDSNAKAMTFRIQWSPEEKINVIIGDGPIEDGDAGRLDKVIPLAGRDRYGNIPLYLNSPGGSVTAALAIVEVMDREEFSALVGSGGRCASACASIIYISARYHLVIDTGLLGIHTCYAVNRQSGNRSLARSVMKLSRRMPSIMPRVMGRSRCGKGTTPPIRWLGLVRMWLASMAYAGRRDLMIR